MFYPDGSEELLEIKCSYIGKHLSEEELLENTKIKKKSDRII